MTGPLAFEQEFSKLSSEEKVRHEELVDVFGQFIFWLRNSSLRATRSLVESEEARDKLGTVRCNYYKVVAALPKDDRDASIGLAEETLNGFIERLLWCLGDEGIDARIGSQHAYRFKIEMEIVNVETNRVVHSEPINRGGRFFGNYWGRWLNRHRNQ